MGISVVFCDGFCSHLKKCFSLRSAYTWKSVEEVFQGAAILKVVCQSLNRNACAGKDRHPTLHVRIAANDLISFHDYLVQSEIVLQ